MSEPRRWRSTTTGAAVTLPELHTQLWQHWTTNPASRKRTTTRYLTNAHIAAEHFIRWLNKTAPGPSYREFLRMLRKMHALTTEGLERVPHASYNPRQMSPGALRVDRRARPSVPSTPVVWLEEPFTPVVHAGIAEVLDHNRTHMYLEICRRKYAVRIVPEKRRASSPRVGTVRCPVQGLGLRDACPIHVDSSTSVFMEAPGSGRQQHRYLRVAAAIMRGLVRNAIQGVALKREQDAFIRKVSHFYQVMIRCHPFQRQNNSVLMNIVNAILFSGIGCIQPHSRIDILAYCMDTVSFQELFRRLLRPTRVRR